MTNEEVAFCNLVQSYILGTFGYLVLSLDRTVEGQTYILRAKRLGDAESSIKRFPVFPDQLMNSIRTCQLPESLFRDFSVWLK